MSKKFELFVLLLYYVRWKKNKETLIKSFAHIVPSDFLSVCPKNRRNADALRGFFEQTGGKYANKMCK